MTKPKKSIAIYARVSTDKQTTDLQLNELRDFVKRSGWTIYQEFIDEGYSGSNTKRPAFSEMMDQAKKRRFDTLVVWKLDRLGRSLKDLINTLDELGSLGIDFISYDNKLDTTTPSGRLVFNVIGAVAEFEKDIIRERVKAGLVAAKARGKRLGRPPISPHLSNQAKELRSKGLSHRKIAKKLKISEGSVRNLLKNKLLSVGDLKKYPHKAF